MLPVNVLNTETGMGSAEASLCLSPLAEEADSKEKQKR